MKIEQLVEVLAESALQVAQTPEDKAEVEEGLKELRELLSAATEEGDKTRMVLNLIASKLELAT
jgi:F0F1-type ATP synthase epsilon subunit